MVKNISKKIVLATVFMQFFSCLAPSGRSRSRDLSVHVPITSADIPTQQPSLSTKEASKTISPQPKFEPEKIVPAPPKKIPMPIISQEPPTSLDTPVITQEEDYDDELDDELDDEAGNGSQQMSALPNQEIPSLFDFFQYKVEQSTALTKGITDYFFQLTQEVLNNDDKKSAQENAKKVRVLFDGLRYPLYRHLRDVISACSDRNSFFNGLVEATLLVSTESPGNKEALIKNLQEIAQTLKEFKIYHIDKPLDTEIENHIKKIQTLLTRIKKFTSKDTERKTLEKIATHVNEIVTHNYLDVLQRIQTYLQDSLIAPNLPAREGLAKYGLRVGYKGAKTVGKFALGKALSAAATIGLTKLSNYLQGIKASTSFDVVKNRITERTKEIPDSILEQTHKVIPEPFFSENAKKFISSPSGAITAGAGALTLGAGAIRLGSELLPEGTMKDTVSAVSGTVAQGAGAVALGAGAYVSGLAGAAASGIKYAAQHTPLPFVGVSASELAKQFADARKRTILENMQYGLLNAVWPATVNQYIIPFISQRFIVDTIFYLTQIPQTSLDLDRRKDFYELLSGLNTSNFNLMTDSTNFICVYLEEIVNKIIGKPELPIDELTKTLQSFQIELFRHRRFIISELSKDKAFTGNYLSYLHSEYLANRNVYFDEKDIANPSTKNIKFEKGAFIVISQEGMKIVKELAERNHNDPQNKKDLITLRGPIANNELKDLIIEFERLRKKIVSELKSFGAQSRYQLIQNYWNSVIDQEYSTKIKSHIADLTKDMRNLVYHAQEAHPLAIVDQGQFIPVEYADGVPVEIPLPLISPNAALLLNEILVQQYIEPLDYIARTTGQYKYTQDSEGKLIETAEENQLYTRLPAGKNWWVKYPLLFTKAAIKTNIHVAKTVADEGVIPIAIAFFTGGSSAALLEAKRRLAFSGIAATVLGIDFTSLEAAASSAIATLASVGGGREGWASLIGSPNRFALNIKSFYEAKVRRPIVHLMQR